MNNRGVLIFSGLVILGIHIKISLLSHSFIFGVEHAQRPIIEFLSYTFLAFGVYWVVLEQLWRNKAGREVDRFNLAWIFIVGILARLIYFPSAMIQETDPYRYIWDGQMMAAKHNPYSFSPQEAFDRGILPESSSQSKVRYVNERINYPDVKTIYPPGAQFLFWLSQVLTPWSLSGWKAMIAVAEILILVLTVLLLRHLGRPQEWVALYAWSPLVIKEFSNSLHLDVFAVLFICLMLCALTKKYYYRAIVSLAAATTIKWFPLAFLPLILLFLDNGPKKRVAVGLFLATLLLSYLPFLSAGWTVFEGLFRFASQWQINDSLFSVIKMISSSLAFSSPGVDSLSRMIICLIFALVISLTRRWFSRNKDLPSFAQSALFLVACVFFLAPTGNPWYFTWLFPFLIIFPSRALVIFSGLVFLYYLDFYFMYHSQRHLFEWVRLVEYGVFFVILGVELWIKNRQWPLLSRFTTRALAS